MGFLQRWLNTVTDPWGHKEVAKDRWQLETMKLAVADGDWIEIDPTCGLCIGQGNQGGECRRRQHPDCEMHDLTPRCAFDGSKMTYDGAIEKERRMLDGSVRTSPDAAVWKCPRGHWYVAGAERITYDADPARLIRLEDQ